ncbi:hypothetical protein [Halalkalibacter okhensis]|uniref:Uncharacterized protein n=1 Tax=Halalkalibacter okhensis TaxID=333138 RepID=A0A0B0IAT0_9BACI|nr:hypothetical protein [Halalkalibacter okhensis]KHF37952.1 hypothetical protein LQ50_24260 [Halalkalibacter okhensis]
MEAAYYNDLSIYVPKNQLDKLITGVLQDKYRIFWGFNKGRMILNIYNSEVNNKLTFIRHKGFLELVEAKVKSPNVLKVLDNDIDFTVKAASQNNLDVRRNKETVYNEIDHFLIELLYFKKIGDVQSMHNIKDKLAELTHEWNRLTLSR